ncbi:MAG: D-alanyl-D-alanine carboxypeptidase/D-alanyl-D-alanine-endopeptidase [Candidatus Brocadiia bacterium]
MLIKQRTKNLIPALLLILCLALPSAVILAASPTTDIAGRIDSLVVKHHLTKSHLGVKIISWPERQVVYEKNPDYLMAVASNMKLITTGVALCKLGPDFQFATSLYYDGVIQNETLQGNLVVKSNGDPNISGRFYNDKPLAVFEQWRNKLAGLGVTNVQGNIILDDTAFDRDYVNDYWPSNQLNCWYCAPVSGIAFNDNCIDITVRPAENTKAATSPPTKYVSLINNSYPGSRNTLTFCRLPGTNVITVKGAISGDILCHKESVPVDNPVLFFGTVLSETMTKNITISGKVVLAERAYDPKADRLTEICRNSTDLKKTITVTNQRSQNLYAEQIFKLLGCQFKGKGTFETGAAAVGDFLDRQVNIPSNTYLISDGSGLARSNWVAPGQMVQFLSYMAGHKYFNDYRDSLNNRAWPEGNNKKKSRIWAKTGTINNVKCLSGYVCGDNGKPRYIFSIMNNGLEYVPEGPYGALEFQNEVAKLLAEEK